MAIEPYNYFEIGSFSSNPMGPESRFVGEAEGGIVFKRDEFEASFSYGCEKRFLKEQSIRIGDQGETGDPGREFVQNLLAPVGHLLALPVHAASVRVTAWSYQSMSFWSSWRTASGIFSATLMMVA